MAAALRGSGNWIGRGAGRQCIAAFEACRDGPMPVPKVPPPVGDTCHRSALQSAATHFSGHGLLRFAEWNRDEPRRATRLHAQQYRVLSVLVEIGELFADIGAQRMGARPLLRATEPALLGSERLIAEWRRQYGRRPRFSDRYEADARRLMTAVARQRKLIEGLHKLSAVLRLNRATNLVRRLC
jgi:hypothetical protein